MNSTALNLVFLAGGWIAYGVLHSVLASLTLKRWLSRRLPGLMPAYRLVYNAVAVGLILPLLWFTYSLPGPALWAWHGPWGWLANILAAGAIAGFLWSLRYYDGAEFLGLRQLLRGEHAPEDQEHLHLSPLHRVVRHPWYSFGLVILWTRDMNAPLLVTAAALTLYLVIGSRLEERQLIAYYGDAYREYRRRVPALIPLPWKRLDSTTAKRLEQQASGHGVSRTDAN